MLHCVIADCLCDCLERNSLYCNNIPSFEKFPILKNGNNKFALEIKQSLVIKRDRPILNKSIISAKLFNYNIWLFSHGFMNTVKSKNLVISLTKKGFYKKYFETNWIDIPSFCKKLELPVYQHCSPLIMMIL